MYITFTKVIFPTWYVYIYSNMSVGCFHNYYWQAILPKLSLLRIFLSILEPFWWCTWSLNVHMGHSSIFFSVLHLTQNCLVASQSSMDRWDQREKNGNRSSDCEMWEWVVFGSIHLVCSVNLEAHVFLFFFHWGKCPYCLAWRPWLRASPKPSQPGWDKQRDEGHLI